MSRLRKKASMVYPGESSAELIIHTPNDEYTQQYYGKSFRTAQQLISGLQLVQTNERVLELTRYIDAGFFDDISTLDNAASRWYDWMGRTRDIFAASNIAIPGDKPHDPKFKTAFALSYMTSKQLIQQLPMPENQYRVVKLAREIMKGSFGDISDVSEAGTHWAAWLNRTKNIFRADKTLLAKNKTRLKKGTR